MLSHIPGVVDPATVATVLSLLKGAGFEDGRATASGQAADVKRNLQVEQGSPLRKQLDGHLMQALTQSASFMELAFPKAIAPLTYNRYDVGMFYGDHVDAPFLNAGRIRADLSFTLFLSDPAAYDGGELVVRYGAGRFAAKYPAGDLVLYPTTSLHHVAPVTRGLRLAAVSWVQSYIQDERQRHVLADMTAAKVMLERLAPEAPETNQLRNALFNLLRLWWQP